MSTWMRCRYCGTLQDEPKGAKICSQCGGELASLAQDPWVKEDASSCPLFRAQLELDQVAAPARQSVERNLLITVETPDALPPSESLGTAEREAVHFVAVLDVSGSMRGEKIAAAKVAVRQAVQRLQPAQGSSPGDLFSLIVFSTEVRCLARAKPVNVVFTRVIESLLQEIDAGGQTALCGGLELGIKEASAAPAGTRLVLLLSDGQANVGETDIEAVGRRALDARRAGVTVSTLGVGLDYNEALMAEIAIDGGGRFYHIEKASQIAAYLTGELGEMASLAVRDMEVTLNLPARTVVQTLSSAYPVRGNQVTLGDIPLATTLEVVVRVLLPAQPAGSRLSIDGGVHCQSPAGNAWDVALNRVTVRYQEEPSWTPVEGVVRPVVRRVFRQMQAASVLATSKAAARGAAEGREKREGELAAMTRYASLLGQDQEASQELAESERVLGVLSAPAAGAPAKRATADAMRRQRGSKNFDQV